MEITVEDVIEIIRIIIGAKGMSGGVEFPEDPVSVPPDLLTGRKNRRFVDIRGLLVLR